MLAGCQKQVRLAGDAGRGGKVRAGICIPWALSAMGGTGDMNVGVEDF